MSGTASTSGSQTQTHDQNDGSAVGKLPLNVGEDRPKEILTELPSLKRKRTTDDEHENSSVCDRSLPMSNLIMYYDSDLARLNILTLGSNISSP